MKASPTPPITSKLSHEPFDYCDSFSLDLAEEVETIDTLISAFFSTMPLWIRTLVKIRNRLAKILALKVDNTQDLVPNSPYVIGQKFGFFTLYSLDEDEVIMGEQDRHLDFKVSLLINEVQRKEISIATVVTYHNLLGKVYFFVVKPFHKIIVKSILKKMKREILVSNVKGLAH